MLFVIYINDIAYEIQSKCLLYADGTSLFEVVDSLDNTALISNKDLKSIQSLRWATKWLITINSSKSECMAFSSKWIRPFHSDLFYNRNKIKVSKHIHLVVTLSSNLIWRAHIFSVYQKASKRLRAIFSEFRESEDSHEKSIFLYFAKTYLWVNLFKEK